MTESVFYELLVEALLNDNLSKLDFESNEQWFIDQINKMYLLNLDIDFAKNLIEEAWKYKCDCEEYDIEPENLIDEYDNYTESY